MQFDKVFTIKKENSKDEFFRKVLIELATHKDTPADVVKASFEDVKEKVREVLVCSAHVESDYSVSVGYERIEEYWDKEIKMEYVDDKWCEHYVDVKKERTITDWHPYRGHTSGDVIKATFNDNENTNREIDNLMIKAITSAKNDSIVEKGEAKVNYSSLSLAKEMCACYVESSVNFLGDVYKDDEYSSDVDVKEVECYILPFYEVKFTYGKKKYYACGFACGNVDIYTELPLNNIDIEEQIDNDTKDTENAVLVGWSFYAVLFCLACVMIAIEIYWTWVFPLVMLVIAIAFDIKNKKVYNEKLKLLIEDNVKIKKKELDSVLAKYGYDMVTSDESSIFNFEAKKSRSYVSSHEKKVHMGVVIFFSIVTIILIIVSFVCGVNNKNATLHSPDQFTFSVTQKSQEYKYDGSYINGCYYIYLTYQVSADEIGADYIRLKVYVYKNGTELGYIISSLSNINLCAGETKTYRVYLSDNQPKENNNTFFIAMYVANASDLTYRFEVESIKFSDGKSYPNI